MNRTRNRRASEYLTGLGLLLAAVVPLYARAQSAAEAPTALASPTAPPVAAGSPFAAQAEGKPQVPAPPAPNVERTPQTRAGDEAAAPLPSARQRPQTSARGDEPEVDFQQEDGLVTLHSDDLDIRRLLEVISRRGGLNLAISPKVQGTITANFEKVSIQELLRSVLKLANLVEKVDGEIHFIYSREEMRDEALASKKERTVIKVYRLNYIRADEMMVIIAPFLSDDVGKKRFATTANYPFGISESSTLTTGGMGSPTGVAGGGAMAGGAAGGVVASGGTIQRGTQPPTGGSSYSDNDTLVIQDYESNIKVIDQIIQRLDVQPIQVLIEAVIISVSLTKDTQLGVNFAVVDHLGQQLGTVGSGAVINGNVGFTPAQVLTAAGKIAANAADPSGFASGANGIKYGFIANNVTGFINALETLGSTKILASPRILVLNKQRAEIQLGERLGFRTLSQNFTSTIQQVQFLNTGTLLRIRPFVSNDGMVRMEIHPERSQGAVTDDLPNITTAQLTTNVMVANGSTLVIGGLMEEEDNYNQTGLPGLSRAPVLGHLFGMKDKLNRRRELVVLLTPHIWTAGPAALHGAGLVRNDRAGKPDDVKQASAEASRPAAENRESAPAELTLAPSAGLSPAPEPVPVPAPVPAPPHSPGQSDQPSEAVEEPPRSPLLLDVGPQIDATSRVRPAAAPPIEPSPSPPVARRPAPGVGGPKADPSVALAGYRPEAPAAPKPSGGRRHEVRSGETFESVAQSYYGSPRFARALWWANRGTITWPGALAAGKQLVIPPVGDLDPKMVGGQEAAMNPAALPKLERITARPTGDRRAVPRVDPQVQPARAPKPEPKPTPREETVSDGGGGMAIHVVRPNETIRSIARARFGDDSRAREIADLNRDLLQAEGRPRVGQRLILPAGASPSPR